MQAGALPAKRFFECGGGGVGFVWGNSACTGSREWIRNKVNESLGFRPRHGGSSYPVSLILPFGGGLPRRPFPKTLENKGFSRSAGGVKRKMIFSFAVPLTIRKAVVFFHGSATKRVAQRCEADLELALKCSLTIEDAEAGSTVEGGLRFAGGPCKGMKNATGWIHRIGRRVSGLPRAGRSDLGESRAMRRIVNEAWPGCWPSV